MSEDVGETLWEDEVAGVGGLLDHGQPGSVVDSGGCGA